MIYFLVGAFLPTVLVTAVGLVRIFYREEI